MVPVDLQKSKESNSFMPYAALVKTGATYNFVLQAVVNAVAIRLAKAGRQKKAVAKLPMVATINGKLLRTMAVI